MVSMGERSMRSEALDGLDEEAVAFVTVDAPTGVGTTAITIGAVSQAAKDKLAGQKCVRRIFDGVLHFILVHRPLAGSPRACAHLGIEASERSQYKRTDNETPHGTSLAELEALNVHSGKEFQELWVGTQGIADRGGEVLPVHAMRAMVTRKMTMHFLSTRI